jgi:hypothetical protein
MFSCDLPGYDDQEEQDRKFMALMDAMWERNAKKTPEEREREDGEFAKEKMGCLKLLLKVIAFLITSIIARIWLGK